MGNEKVVPWSVLTADLRAVRASSGSLAGEIEVGRETRMYRELFDIFESRWYTECPQTEVVMVLYRGDQGWIGHC